MTGSSPVPSSPAIASPPAGVASPSPKTESPAPSSEGTPIVFTDDSARAGHEAGPPGGAQIPWGRQITITLIWLVVICGGAWFILRLFYSSATGLGNFGRRGRRRIQVLDRQVLGPQKALLLVEVPGKVVLVGVTEQQIRTLAELNPDDLLDTEEADEPAVAVLPASGPVRRGADAPDPEEQQLADLFGRKARESTSSSGRP